MRIKQILVAFLFATLVISCGNKAKDINVKELKTECEALDAMLIVADEVVELVEAVDSEEGASEEQKKEYKLLSEKAEEIQDYLEESDFSKKAFKNCPKYETLERLEKKMRKARKLLK
jgi:myo-inositol-1-phosphate synthase